MSIGPQMPDIEEQENAGESTLTIGVPGGLAGALTNFGYQPDAADPLGQQLLQAAVLQLAPSRRLTPCQDKMCCWRWAAGRLLQECSSAFDTSKGLRASFDKLLNESKKQQLLDLQADHEARRLQLQKVLRQLEQSRELCREQANEVADLKAAYEASIVTRERAAMQREDIGVWAAVNDKKFHDRLEMQLQRNRVVESRLESSQARESEKDQSRSRIQLECNQLRLENHNLQIQVELLQKQLATKRKKKPKGKKTLGSRTFLRSTS